MFTRQFPSCGDLLAKTQKYYFSYIAAYNWIFPSICLRSILNLKRRKLIETLEIWGKKMFIDIAKKGGFINKNHMQYRHFLVKISNKWLYCGTCFASIVPCSRKHKKQHCHTTPHCLIACRQCLVCLPALFYSPLSYLQKCVTSKSMSWNEACAYQSFG